MKTHLLFTIVTFFSVNTLASADSSSLIEQIPNMNNWLKPYDAVYNVYRSGDKKGKVNRTLKPQNGNWELYTQSKISLFLFKDKRIEKTTFKMDKGAIKPLSYFYEVDNSLAYKKTTEYFDWDLNIIKGERLKKGNWQIPLKRGVSNPLSNQLVIRQYLISHFKKSENLKIEKPITLSLDVSSKGTISPWQYQIESGEIVHTKAGDLKTIKVIRSHGTRRTLFWFSPSMEFIPVKIFLEKNGKEQGTMILKKVKFEKS